MGKVPYREGEESLLQRPQSRPPSSLDVKSMPDIPAGLCRRERHIDGVSGKTCQMLACQTYSVQIQPACRQSLSHMLPVRPVLAAMSHRPGQLTLPSLESGRPCHGLRQTCHHLQLALPRLKSQTQCKLSKHKWALPILSVATNESTRSIQRCMAKR